MDNSKGDQARAEILDAAQPLFVSQGYHGTSMRDIARAAGGRAVAGLYNHFPTKEAIFEALIAERNPYNDLFTGLETALTDADDAAQFVHTVLRVVLRIMPQHYDFIQLAQIDMREFGGKNMQQILEGGVFPRIWGLFQRLSTLPGFKPVEQIVWMRLMASLIIGYMVTARNAPIAIFRQYSDEEWADRFAEILLYGVSDQGT